MSLIRGFGGLFPCPICLVPADELFEHNEDGYEWRTMASSQQVVKDANSMARVTARNQLLKNSGLHGIEVHICVYSFHRSVLLSWQNTFWAVRRSDPHRALSFDRLHAIHGGLVKVHLLPEIQNWLASIGRSALVKGDSQ